MKNAPLYFFEESKIKPPYEAIPQEGGRGGDMFCLYALATASMKSLQGLKYGMS